MLIFTKQSASGWAMEAPMTRTVKLTTREPEHDQTNALLGSCDTVATNTHWRAAHDAADDDATKALEDLVRAARAYGDLTCPDMSVEEIKAGECLLNALDRLRATKAGAALIRQKEGRDDAGE
jgi:hypothetical protein